MSLSMIIQGVHGTVPHDRDGPEAISTNSSDSKSTHYITESGNNRLSLHDSLDHELDENIFESRAVLDYYCPVERADVDQVLNWLERQYGLRHDCILDSCSSLDGNFSPLEGGSVPLANILSLILSKIISACTAQIGSRVGKENPMDHMQFSVQEATPEVGKKSCSMVLGTINVQCSNEIDWRDAPFCLLLYDSWSLLHSHGTVYARNRFTNFKNREWVPIIFVASDNNYVQVRIGIFTRSGLFTTESLDFLSGTVSPPKPCDWKEEYKPMITKEQAFRKFVRGIVGLYNAEYTKAGIDITRHPTSPHIFLPPPLGLGVIKEIHCERQCVKGRATRVYRVQQDAENCFAALQDLEEGFRVTSLIPIEIQEMQQTTPDYVPLQTTNLSLNWVVVIKDCWSCASENNELTIFRTLNGCFGLPILLYGYSVRNSNALFPQFEDGALIPHDARVWNPVPGHLKTPKPLQRIHERLIFKTLGRSILTARSPRELLRAIAHAVLGHYNMFKRGWLHCDVSIGNVLIMDPVEVRSPVTDFEFSKSVNRCEGFLTDGDQAVCRADGEYKWTASGRPKGTPMFMSQKLIKAWNSGRLVAHTPIDDLESFVWVLVWAIFDILKSRRISLHPVEETFITFMSSRNLSSILCRMDVAEFVQRPDTDASLGFRPFIPLLRDWFRIVSSADQKREVLNLSQSQEEHTSIYKDVYGEYLEAVFNRLEDLPQMWETDGSASVPIEGT
ncbi:hypothetical protein Clacol_006539 [Clathrus columnatus]|uniref:Fungal-type protein kinase domain-containing protein n=1 Tax=Clathrus columnatus TaxID=1419009 RepID=A0AAV5AHX9_9AGAM|nr:hypothetical protein Clacol_006539 [Clathrus columnatus]